MFEFTAVPILKFPSTRLRLPVRILECYLAPKKPTSPVAIPVWCAKSASTPPHFIEPTPRNSDDVMGLRASQPTPTRCLLAVLDNFSYEK
jgi:hypothetical protein